MFTREDMWKEVPTVSSLRCYHSQNCVVRAFSQPYFALLSHILLLFSLYLSFLSLGFILSFFLVISRFEDLGLGFSLKALVFSL